jgi:hypothetical protein
MDCATLINKLVEIEREVGRQISPDVHSLLMEAQFCAVQLYRDRIEILNENIKLRGALMTALTLLPSPEQDALMAPQQAA